MWRHLPDRAGDARLVEGEVLESPGQAPVDSRVTDRGTCIGGELGLNLCGRGTRLQSVIPTH
jgi:hypothetical protein